MHKCVSYLSVFIFSTQIVKAKVYLSSEDTVSLTGNETAHVPESRQTSNLMKKSC